MLSWIRAPDSTDQPDTDILCRRSRYCIQCGVKLKIVEIEIRPTPRVRDRLKMSIASAFDRERSQRSLMRQETVHQCDVPFSPG
jgi:ribosomal protein S26